LSELNAHAANTGQDNIGQDHAGQEEEAYPNAVAHHEDGRDEPSSRGAFRPSSVTPVALGSLGEEIGVVVPEASASIPVTGISLNSRSVESGDLYVALPGATRHGADFVGQAVSAGAVAVLTDDAGARQLALATDIEVPVLIARDPRALVGALAAHVYATGGVKERTPTLFGVTGTNGKTTTTYFINALLRSLGKTPGLIGTIEILAGGEPIPSLLTTPESTDVHALLALMRERGLDAVSMEVSSHAVSFHRVDGVIFDVAGFTNLTQDHLDLHGTMEDYFQTKASLFTSAHAASAVVTVDDEWGRRLARSADIPLVTLSTRSALAAHNADWTVEEAVPRGLGTGFKLRNRDGREIRVHTGLPGAFNVSNAALATLMVLHSGVDEERLQQALDAADPFSTSVPGRMQLVSKSPAAVVDFAHNPDALSLALEALRPSTPGSRLIVVFGATGQRDKGKRPTMGAIAARLADVVIVTDDDPHDEDAALIRADVLAGAAAAKEAEGLDCTVMESFPRGLAIRQAVDLAGPEDTILIAGRGHEVWQEVQGVNLALDDREELRAALTARGFSALEDQRIES
jgi:UDP-N-acetylmuramoyl-L-alanyl-D-glutamate--2,6-diaminopimelate ligase